MRNVSEYMLVLAVCLVTVCADDVNKTIKINSKTKTKSHKITALFMH